MENCKDRIDRLARELAEVKELCENSERKFKTGDWVCFNHGEYPEYFSYEPWQITHWSYKYLKKGAPMGWVHKGNAGMAHDEDCLRYAHPDEIAYYLSGLPHFYNRKSGCDMRISVDGDHFKIGDMIDTKKLGELTGKQFLTFLLDLDLFNSEASQKMSKILEVICNPK